MHNLFNSLTVAPPPALFYPFGSGVGDTLNPRSDDGSSPAINLQSPFTFFRRTYTKLYVNNNGHLTFDQPWDSYTPTQFNAYSGRDIIAPLWTDIDNRGAGTISYNQYSNGNVLSQATRDINQHFPQFIFTASWVFVATWDKVAYYSYSGTVTFQVVLVSDSENRSYVLMNYGSIPPSPQVWMAGYKTENNTYNFTIQASNTSSLSSTTNVGIPGRWVFRVDGTASALFYPFGSGAGDTVNPRSDDGSSPAINLQSPFTFFRRTYTKLYVNNNGHLTFDQPWDSFTPTQFNAYSGRDIIAPLWTDIDNRATGNISYNQYSNGNVLSQATRDINQYFPQFIFTASWVFVATWDKVAYYSYSGTHDTSSAHHRTFVKHLHRFR
uniref:NIDO domain-containing protein n=1 Tax=Pygocentrus nattereri TaxID=42514 RepID=A0A3B4EIL8_PYGNA